MEYNKLVSVTGLPGLYELVASKTDGAIVRSLDDNSTRFVASRVHNFSHLESIEVYTAGDNINLVDVFHAMEKSDEALPSEKDADAVKKYFEKVYADMDFDRVYSSDMKKMIKWFDVLKKNNIEIKLKEEDNEDESESNKQDEIPAGGLKDNEEAKTENTEPVTKKEQEPVIAETQAAKKKNTKK